MLPLAEARALIQAHTRAAAPVRRPLAQALGRVLREEVTAPEDLPAFDRSAMDGYAYAPGSSAERFRVVAEIQPGPPPEGLVLGAGECARVFTGAPIPQGATAVLMQENARREGEWMIPQQRDEETHIRRRGEDLAKGETVLRAGVRLTPAELSLLAYLGHVEPLVSPAPRVIHVATGRELVPPGEQPAPGQIRDSNSTLIAAELAVAGAELVGQTRVGDELSALLGSIRAFDSAGWDVLLLSGGASVGDYDFGPQALEALGFTIHFTKLDLRPGKPLIYATRGAQQAFVIPGNPVSHFVLFHVAIRAALDALEGAPAQWPLVPVTLTAPIEGRANPRETYWPARVSVGQRGLEALPLKWQSSGDLTGLRGANALLQVPGKIAPPREQAQCLLLRCAILS